jgi:transcriptional regulator with XRE-family HTH domain
MPSCVDRGTRLRLLRAALGVGQAKLAEDAGISANTLSNLETGRHDTRGENLDVIATAMGVQRKALEDDLTCVLEFARIVGVDVRPFDRAAASDAASTPPSSLEADVGRLLASVLPEQRAGVLTVLRGLLVMFAPKKAP